MNFFPAVTVFFFPSLNFKVLTTLPTVTFVVAFAFLLFLAIAVIVTVPFFFARMIPFLEIVAIFLLLVLYFNL